MLHDGVAQGVVYFPGRLLDRLENDILVVTGDHAVRKFDPLQVFRIQVFHGNLILPGGDLVHPIDLDSAKSSCKFRHSVIQTFYHVLEFSVVSKFLRKLNKAVVLRD